MAFNYNKIINNLNAQAEQKKKKYSKESANRAGFVSNSTAIKSNQNNAFNYDRIIKKLNEQSPLSSAEKKDSVFAKSATGNNNPLVNMFKQTTPSQDRQLIKDVADYKSKYANSSLKEIKTEIAKPNITQNERNYLSNIGNVKQKAEKEADYKILSQMSDEDIIGYLEFGDNMYSRNRYKNSPRITLNTDDKDSTIIDYIKDNGSSNLLSLYQKHLHNDDYEKTDTLSNALTFGNGYNETVVPNEEEINQIEDLKKVRQGKERFESDLEKYSKNADWEKYSNKSTNTVKKFTEALMEAEGQSYSDMDKVYNYLYHTQGEDKADEYSDAISAYANWLSAEGQRKQDEKYSKENLVLSTLSTFPENLASSFTFTPLVDAVKKISGQDIDTNDVWHRATKSVNTRRSTVSNDIDSDIGKFLYNTTNSAIDSAVSMAASNSIVGGISGSASVLTNNVKNIENTNELVSAITSTIMGTQAATNGIIEGKENGYSDTKAVSLGIIQGLIEGATEKYSIDSILSKPTLINSFIAEGSEEVASNWANNVVDAIVNGNKSDFNKDIKNYLKENPNASQGKAFANAIVNSLENDGLSFLAGGVSGAAMSGVAKGINKVGDYKQQKQENKEIAQYFDTIANDENITDTSLKNQATTIRDKLMNGEEVTDYEQMKFVNRATAVDYNLTEQTENTEAVPDTVQVATKDGIKEVKSSLSEKHPNGILVKSVAEQPDAKGVTRIISSGNGEMTLTTDIGTTAELSEIEFASPLEQKKYNIAGSFDTNGAKQFIWGFDEYQENHKKSSLDDYAASYSALYQAGTRGINYEQTQNVTDLKTALDDMGTQARNAINAGLNDRKAVMAEQAKLQQQVQAKQQEQQLLESQQEVFTNGNEVFESLANDYEDTDAFSDLFNKVYTAGKRGVSFESLKNNINYADSIRELGENKVQQIVNAGQQDLAIQQNNEVAVFDDRMSETKAESKSSSGQYYVTPSAQDFINNSDTESGVDYIEAGDVIDNIARSLGINIVAETPEDMKIRNVNKKSVNGYFADGEFHINVEHGADGMLFAVTHESVHWLRSNNPNGYYTLRSYVFDVLTDSNINLDERTKQIIDQYMESGTLNLENITDSAQEEIISNAFGTIINSEEALQKAYNLSKNKKHAVISAIKSIIKRLKNFLKKISGSKAEVRALYNNTEAQIRMAEIFCNNLEQSVENSQRNNNAIEDVKYSKYAPNNSFEKALTKDEWSSFFASSMKNNQRDGLRIGDHCVIVPITADSCKLVCYDNSFQDDQIDILAVYKIENFDYNIHTNEPNILKFIEGVESGEISNDNRWKILDSYLQMSGAVLRKYNSANKRYYAVKRRSTDSRRNVRGQSDRGNSSAKNTEINTGKLNSSLSEVAKDLPVTEFTAEEQAYLGKQKPTLKLSLSDNDFEFTESDRLESERLKAMSRTNRFAVNMLMRSSEDIKATGDMYHTAAKNILAKYNSTMSVQKFAKSAKALIEFAEEKGLDRLEDLSDQIAQLCNTAIEKSDNITDTFKEEREVFKKVINGRTLLLSDRQVQMLNFGDGVQHFKQKMFGTCSIGIEKNARKSITGGYASSDGNTVMLAEVYGILQDDLGKSLLPDVYEDEMPEKLLQLKEILKPKVEVIDGTQKEDMAYNMMQDYIAELVSVKYGKENSKIKKELTELKKTQQDWKNKILREFENASTKFERYIDKYTDHINAQKERELNLVRTKYERNLMNYRDRRLKTIYKEKIRSMCNRLANMTDRETRKEGIPMPVELIKYMTSIADVISPGETRTGKKIINGWKAFNRLGELYKALQNKESELNEDNSKKDSNPNEGNSKNTYADHYKESIYLAIGDLQKQIGDTPLNKLNGYQLEHVYDILKVIEDNFREAKKVIVDGKKRAIAQVGSQICRDIQAVKGVKQSGEETKRLQQYINSVNNGINSFTNYSLDARRFFLRLCDYNENSPLMGIVRELDKADSREATICMESYQVFEDVVNKYKKKIKKFDGKKAEWQDFGITDKFTNKKIHITPGMAITIYQQSLNEDNRRHFMIEKNNKGNAINIPGGLKIPNMLNYQKHFGNPSKMLANPHTAIISEKSLEQIKAFVENNEACKAFSNATEEFFNTVSRKYIDEVAKELYGYPISIAGHYFPINTDKNYVNKPFDSVVRDARLENTGFTQSRQHSKNPINLLDVSMVVQNHISQMSRYTAFTPAVKNFEKVYNYVAPGYNDSLKEVIANKWGKGAIDYIDKLMGDINNPYKFQSDSRFTKLRGNFAQAVLAVNVSVTMIQAASYPTAAAVIGYKPLMKALAVGENAKGERKHIMYRANRAEINELTGVYWDRYQGDNRAELQGIINNTNWTQGKMAYLMNWIQKADVATTGRLFQACKYYVQDNFDFEIGSEEYKNKLKDTFEEVIKCTQPQYSVMHRPMVLRSNSEIIRTVTMFMTQRLQNFGIIQEATGNYRAKARAYKQNKTAETKANLDKARTKFIHSISSQVVSATTIVAMTLLAKGLLGDMDRYRDKEGDITFFSIMNRYYQDLIETMTGNFLWGSELYNAISNIIDIWHGNYVYDTDIINMGALENVNELVKELNNIVALFRSENVSPEKLKKSIKNICSKIGQLTGVPVDNFRKVGLGIYNNFWNCIEGNPLNFENGSKFTLTVSDYAGLMYDKLINGDKEGYTKLYNKAQKDGHSFKKIQSAIKESLLDDLTLQEAATALNKNDLETYKRKVDVLISKGFEQSTVKKAADSFINNVINAENEQEEKELKSDYSTDEVFDGTARNYGKTDDEIEEDEKSSKALYNYDDLWRAKQSGNTAAYNEIYHSLLSTGSTEQGIKSAINARVKKEEEKKKSN